MFCLNNIHGTAESKTFYFLLQLNGCNCVNWLEICCFLQWTHGKVFRLLLNFYLQYYFKKSWKKCYCPDVDFQCSFIIKESSQKFSCPNMTTLLNNYMISKWRNLQPKYNLNYVFHSKLDTETTLLIWMSTKFLIL